MVGIWDDLCITHSEVGIETERELLEYAKYRFHNDNDNLNHGNIVLSTLFARLPLANRSNRYFLILSRDTWHVAHHDVSLVVLEGIIYFV